MDCLKRQFPILPNNFTVEKMCNAVNCIITCTCMIHMNIEDM